MKDMSLNASLKRKLIHGLDKSFTISNRKEGAIKTTHGNQQTTSTQKLLQSSVTAPQHLFLKYLPPRKSERRRTNDVPEQPLESSEFIQVGRGSIQACSILLHFIIDISLHLLKYYPQTASQGNYLGSIDTM